MNLIILQLKYIHNNTHLEKFKGNSFVLTFRLKLLILLSGIIADEHVNCNSHLTFNGY